MEDGEASSSSVQVRALIISFREGKRGESSFRPARRHIGGGGSQFEFSSSSSSSHFFREGGVMEFGSGSFEDM